MKQFPLSRRGANALLAALLASAALMLPHSTLAQAAPQKVRLTTSMGDIVVELNA
jgi:hypothetical protein